MRNLREELEGRGLIYQNSNEELFDIYNKGGQSFYIGYDPTADSLHLGNFVGFMAGIHFMRRNNKYFGLIGGATGMIGDPGGKNAERNFLSEEDLKNNDRAITKQVGDIFKNLENIAGQKFQYEIVNNKDFFEGMLYLDFLREVGKFITINQMISKETVKKRIENPDQSISYTEFSYMLLQGYDFYKLYSQRGVKLQMGGSDQWGNLVTGVELIRKKIDKEAYVCTTPLVLDSSGKKFGKSEGNALWLDRNKTSPYQLYQYFMNTTDEDVLRFLKMLTLIEIEQIDEIVKNHNINPEKREGQKLLAYKVVEIIHSKKDAEISAKVSNLLFGNEDKINILKNLKDEEVNIFFNEIGGFKYNDENLFETIVKSGLANSNSQARSLVESSSIFINEKNISNSNYNLSSDFINNKVLFIRKGKKNFKLIIK